MEHVPDPFREARAKDGVLRCPFQGETLPMILRHADVREAAKDWQKFSSDAPFRHAGLDARLTGVEHANVVKKLLA